MRKLLLLEELLRAPPGLEAGTGTRPAFCSSRPESAASPSLRSKRERLSLKSFGCATNLFLATATETPFVLPMAHYIPRSPAPGRRRRTALPQKSADRGAEPVPDAEMPMTSAEVPQRMRTAHAPWQQVQSARRRPVRLRRYEHVEAAASSSCNSRSVRARQRRSFTRALLKAPSTSVRLRSMGWSRRTPGAGPRRREQLTGVGWTRTPTPFKMSE